MHGGLSDYYSAGCGHSGKEAEEEEEEMRESIDLGSHIQWRLRGEATGAFAFIRSSG